MDSEKWTTTQNAVLGAVLTQPEELAGTALSQLTVEDFTGGAREVFKAIHRVFNMGKVPEFVLVNSETQGAYTDYLRQIIDLTVTTAYFPQNVETLRQESRMARLKQTMAEGANADTMDGMREKLTEAQELIIDQNAKQAWDLKTLTMDFYDRKMNGETYLRCGIPQLDSRLFLQPGAFMVIGAMPSRGKTALAIQSAYEQSKSYRVGFYSLETGRKTIFDRLVAHAAEVSMDGVKNPKKLNKRDWDKIAKTASDMSKSRELEIIEAAGWTADDIFAHAIAHRYEVIYIDYLQIIQGSGNSRFEEVTNISIRLHTLAQRNKILTVALSQVSRDFSGSKSEELNLKDLRESGQIEQDADVVMLIYCTEKGNTKGGRYLKIAKNKEGECLKVEMHWDGPTQTMTPVSDREEEAPPVRKSGNKYQPGEFAELGKNTPIPQEFKN